MIWDKDIIMNIDDFLKEHRQKIDEEKKIINSIFNLLQETQQDITDDSIGNITEITSSTHFNLENDLIKADKVSKNDKVKFMVRYGEFSPLNPDLKPSNNKVSELGDYEERRKIFLEKKKCEYQQMLKEITDSIQNSSWNKDSVNFDEEQNSFGENSYFKNDKPKVMVRFGEFSPLNPAFRSPGKPLLGLGEYEERRKIFLEKKKREYQEYLSNVKHEKQQENNKSKLTKDNMKENENPQIPIKSVNEKSCEILSPKRGLRKDIDRCQTLLQQESYRQELDRQISEKRRLQKEQEVLEKAECDKTQREEMIQQMKISKIIDEEFERARASDINSNHNSIDAEKLTDVNVNVFSPSNITESGSNLVSKSPEVENEKNDKRYPRSTLKSPIIRPGADTCAVDDYEKYQKLQNELYKQELAKQIEEKRKLKEERRKKEMEEEQRIEEQFKKQEEKMRQEYEKQLAERAYRAAQQVQEELRRHQSLEKFHKEALERKKSEKKIHPLVLPNPVLPVNHKLQNKSSVKNVSFASQARVYSINEPKKSFNDSVPNFKSDSAIIVEAPYTLSVKNGKFDPYVTNLNAVTTCEKRDRPPSPPIPAVRTRNILKSLPKQDDIFIPSTVSMSKETREKFMKESKLLSNLPEIRKKLLEKNANLYD